MIYGSYYLFPGTIYCANGPSRVTTLLGSCVSVCVWDQKLLYGGINHYLTPFWNGEGLPSPKYGNIAIEKLLEKMYSLGSRKQNMQAKIFGGATLLVNNRSFLNVGQKNIQVARATLLEKGIPIVKQNVGGHRGRKIIFDTHTGVVALKRLNPLSQGERT
jgi:chemotaxis protein CheD